MGSCCLALTVVSSVLTSTSLLPHKLCALCFVQVCHDKFTKNSDLKRHEKGAHPDKPHALVCEVSLF